MSNATIIQQHRLDHGSVKPLLVPRIKHIIDRKDFAAITELQTEADRLWDEMTAFARAPRLIEEARKALMTEKTAACRERLDTLEAQYRSTEYCEKEQDFRQSQLNDVQSKTPAVVYPALRRIQKVLGDIKAEMEAAATKEFEAVGMVYGDADASPILLMVKQELFTIDLLTAKIRAGKFIGAEFPSAALDRYFDLASVKAETLSARLPVPVEAPEPVVEKPREDLRHGIDRNNGKPLKRDIPGVTFQQYGGTEPEAFNSDGAFSRELAAVAKLPSRV